MEEERDRIAAIFSTAFQLIDDLLGSLTASGSVNVSDDDLNEGKPTTHANTAHPINHW